MKTFKLYLKESVSTKSKKEIVKKADDAFVNYIKDLKNSLTDIENGNYEWARYRIESVAAALSKLAPALKEWDLLNKAGKLTESKKVDDRKINFENIAGGIEINTGYDGYYVSNYSGGNGYNKEWKSDEYQKIRSGNDYGSINILREKIVKDLVPVCDRFDRELEAVMRKYGFKK